MVPETLELRRLADAEIDLMIKCRIEYCKDNDPGLTEEQIDNLRTATLHWMNDAINLNRYIAFVGNVNGEIVCCCGLLLYDLPPLRAEKVRRVGHVLNFITFEEFRRKGYGLSLLKFMIEEGRELGLNRLVLNSTEQGELLYEKAGFKDPLLRNMIYEYQ
jgi:GNAT superfamily N-acetyltransferase